jgi:cytochrome bd-type quinol oxidase subunit 2
VKTGLKYAMIFVGFSFLWNCVEYAFGLQDEYLDTHPYFIISFYIILTAFIYYLAISEKRDELGGNITFGKAMITGAILTFFIILVNPLSLYLFSDSINIQTNNGDGSCTYYWIYDEKKLVFNDVR